MNVFSLAKKSIGKVFDSNLFKSLLPSYAVLSIFSLFFTGQIRQDIQGLQEDPVNFNLGTDYWVFTLLGAFIGILYLIYILTALRDVEEKNSFKAPKVNQITSKGFKLLLVSIVSYFFVFLGFLFCIIPGFFLMKRYIYIFNVAVEEELGVLDTMKRSKQLSNKNGWSVLISLVLISIPVSPIYLIIYNSSASFFTFAIFDIIVGYIFMISSCSVLFYGYKDSKVLTI